MAGPSEVIEAVRSAYRSHDDETLLSFLAEDAHIIVVACYRAIRRGFICHWRISVTFDWHQPRTGTDAEESR